MAKLKDATPSYTAGDLRPGGNAAAQLFSFVERLERLDEERRGLVEDAKEVRAEAKGMGYDTKVLGQVIRRRSMDPSMRQKADSMLELYEETVRAAEKAQTQKSQDESE